MRNPLKAFVDPSRHRRLRAWVWVVVAIYGMAGLVVAMNMVTSTKWFCNDVCHMVHADNAKAYYRGAHNRISCIACHYPARMNAAAFMLDRADKLFDVMPAVQRTFEMPLNEYSHVALAMPQTQCTQCHRVNVNREVNGVKIDHKVHNDKGIVCTVCHNRVAHDERDPMTLPGNKPHEDFVKMTACFRCHSHTGDSPSAKFEAPGTCSKCHTPDFDLTPESHDAKGWYDAKGSSKGHAEAAKEALGEVEEVSAEWAEKKPHFTSKKPRIMAEVALKMADYEESLKVDVPPVGTVFECSTCHKSDFCSNCHGTEVPHPDAFKKGHGKKLSAKDARTCAKCHNETHATKYDALTCRQCHHKAFQPAKGEWWKQHPGVIKAQKDQQSFIQNDCYKCHEEGVFCSSCHVRGKPSRSY